MYLRLGTDQLILTRSSAALERAEANKVTMVKKAEIRPILPAVQLTCPAFYTKACLICCFTAEVFGGRADRSVCCCTQRQSLPSCKARVLLARGRPS